MLNNIETERIRNHLSQEELAKKLNISLKTYYNWINERTDAPISKLVVMARMFGTKVDYLIEGMSGAPNKKEKNPHTVIDATVEIDLRSGSCKVTPTATTYDYPVQLTTST